MDLLLKTRASVRAFSLLDMMMALCIAAVILGGAALQLREMLRSPSAEKSAGEFAAAVAHHSLLARASGHSITGRYDSSARTIFFETEAAALSSLAPLPIPAAHAYTARYGNLADREESFELRANGTCTPGRSYFIDRKGKKCGISLSVYCSSSINCEG